MYQYTAYGLRIESAFELPELPAATDPGHPDVVFERGTLDPAPPTESGLDGRHIRAEPGSCRLTYDSFGTFLVDGPSRVVYDPTSTDIVETMAVRRLFENEILGTVHTLRGNLVLHASAVSVDGRGAVFLGPRGAGKSTTALAFDSCGHTVLEDDIVAIATDGDQPMVFPGVPQLRLRPDAVDALGIDETTTHKDDGGSGKEYIDVACATDPVALAGCYVLRDGETFRIEDLPPRSRVIELITRTHAQGLISDLDFETDHYEQCTTVAGSVPFGKLYRPRAHERLPELVETVTTELGDGEGHPASDDSVRTSSG